MQTHGAAKTLPAITADAFLIHSLRPLADFRPSETSNEIDELVVPTFVYFQPGLGITHRLIKPCGARLTSLLDGLLQYLETNAFRFAQEASGCIRFAPCALILLKTWRNISHLLTYLLQ